MKRIVQTYTINAPLHTVWELFINPIKIEAWGGGPAEMNGLEGTNFSLWGGEIHGKNRKVLNDKLLIQDWFSGDWPEPSKVTFTFTTMGSQTTVHLLHENVPDNEAEDIDSGWKKFYLGPIKVYAEA